MEMTVTFTSLGEARKWAADLIGTPLRNEVVLEPIPTENQAEAAPTPDADVPEDDRVKGLGRRQREALEVLIQANAPISTGEVARSLGIKSPAASNVLSNLRKRGLSRSVSRGVWTYLDVSGETPEQLTPEEFPPEPDDVAVSAP
jgi:FixJ family two-component response regulator